jgi:hypothetical protein
METLTDQKIKSHNTIPLRIAVCLVQCRLFPIRFLHVRHSSTLDEFTNRGHSTMRHTARIALDSPVCNKVGLLHHQELREFSLVK